MSAKHWTKEMVLERLQVPRPSPQPSGQAEAVRALREAAAVLSFFDPRTIQPARQAEVTPEAREEFLRSCTIVYDTENQPRWRLGDETRKWVLKNAVESTDLQALLDANPNRSADPTQQMFEAYLRGDAAPLAAQSLEQLSGTLQVAEWASQFVPGIPDPKEISRRIDRQALLLPMRELIGEHFLGREEELARLRDYVGVLPPSSRVESVFRSLREFFSLHERPPLMIHGPGGIGKSTLISKFILDHADLEESARLPFAYLNFDRTDLSAEQPLTLLMDILEQMGRQFECDRSHWQDLRGKWSERLEASRSGDQPGVKSRKPAFETAMELSLDELLGFLEQGVREDLSGRPFLLVMDTFEEVQYRTPHLIVTIWDLLEQFQQRWPRLRTVLVGRSPVNQFQTDNLELGDFKGTAARELVNRLLEREGGADSDLADLVVKKVGGNPLTLKLAVEAILKAGPDSLENLETRRLLFFQLEESVIQGQLYLRVLSHIHDPEIQRLAHPGLILRRITPEVIREILAQPCGVEVESEKKAVELFEDLAREAALVYPAEDGALRHRPDVRRAMVPLLRQTEPELTQQIQQRAVEYYQGREGLVNRAEEVYHRLMLQHDTPVLDERWQEGIEPYLADSLTELPTLGQTYLASQLGIELDRSIWESADLVQWERNVDSRTRELIQLGDFEKALALLEERGDRSPGSVLFLREAEIWRELGELDRAEGAVQEGIDSGLEATESRYLASLLLFQADLQEATGRFQEAYATLGRAAARAQGVPIRSIEIALRRFQLQVRQREAEGSATAPAPARKLVEDVRESLLRIEDERLAENPELALRIALQMGSESQEILVRLLRFLKLHKLQYRHLEPALQRWGSLVGSDDLVRLEGARAGQLLRSLEKLLASQRAPAEVLEALVEGLRQAAADGLARA